MKGAARREGLLKTIKESRKPVSAKELATKYGVSRQVIVQDMALLRASGYDILSTNRGYILSKPGQFTRTFLVLHSDEQIQEELCAIVDLGAEITNVVVHHQVYGTMEAPLNISSRKNVHTFMDEIKNGTSSPLKNITAKHH